MSSTLGGIYDCAPFQLRVSTIAGTSLKSSGFHSTPRTNIANPFFALLLLLDATMATANFAQNRLITSAIRLIAIMLQDFGEK